MFIGLHGLAELRPIAPGEGAFIVVYALACSLVANDVVKLALLRHNDRRSRA